MLKKLHQILSPRSRLQLALLLSLSLFSTAVDVGGMALVTAFMALVASHHLPKQVKFLAKLQVITPWHGLESFATALGCFIIAYLTAAHVISALASYCQVRYMWKQQHELSCKLLERYLRMPYSWFLRHNSTTLSNNVLSSVVTDGILSPAMSVYTKSCITGLIFIALFKVDPYVAVGTAAFLSVAYVGLHWHSAAKTTRLGREAHRSSKIRKRVAAEAMSSIKSIRQLGREAPFLEEYSRQSEATMEKSARMTLLISLPRHFLETIAFGGIISLTLYLMLHHRGVLPMLSLFAMAGYRLIPAANDIFASLTRIRFNLPMLDEYHEVLTTPLPQPSQSGAIAALPPQWQEIRLHDLTFSYSEQTQPALKQVSLTIPRYSSIGIVGASGAGKTTLVDILLGLLEPQQGAVQMDGVSLPPGWQRCIGYVPQDAVLIDDTVLRNIAFGLPIDTIDRDAVERAAKTASLHDFVTSMPQGYDTVIGERGVRVSGGQRQRISIARALYADPEILVLDEATSHLDGMTEAAVMDAIRTLSGRKTLIVVAHRLTTVMHCDRIFMFDRGRLSGQGTYDELMATSQQFQALARGTISPRTDTEPVQAEAVSR